MFGKSWEMIKRGMAVALSVSLLAGAMSVSSSLPTAAASTKRVEVGTKGNVTINLNGREVWQAAADAMQKAQPVTGDIADRIMAQTGSNGNPVVLEDDIYKMELPKEALKGLPTGLGMEMYISAGAEDVAEDYTAAEEGEAAAVVAEVASASDLEATGVAEKPVRDFFASSMFSLIKENDEAAPAGGAAAAGGEGYDLNGSEHIYFVLSNATDQDVNYTVKLGDLEILKTKVLKSHGDTTGVIGASVSDLIGVPASTSNMVRATESDMATASNLMEEAELTDDVVAKVVRTTLKNFFIIYRSEETALGTKAMVVTTADMKFKPKDGGVFADRGDKMTLAVRDITDENELQGVANTLAENNVDHDKFAAVDISFRKGGDSKDYEPCQGQIVNVRIETKAMEGFDPETMSIQHHLDNGEVETVAGTTKKTRIDLTDDAEALADGTVTVTEDAQTEITVESDNDGNAYTFDEDANKAAMEAQLSAAGKSDFKMELGDGETPLDNDTGEKSVGKAPAAKKAPKQDVTKNDVNRTVSTAVNEFGVKTETETETAPNGNIKVEEGKVVADFIVDSFSIYTIVGQGINTVEYLSAADGKTYEVTVDLRGVTNIPEGAELVVEDVTQSEYDKYLNQAAKALKTNADAFTYAKLLDISIVYEGQKIQPNGTVGVEIQLKDSEDISNPQVVHFGKEPEVLDAAKTGNGVAFATTGFSVYAVVDEGEGGDNARATVNFYKGEQLLETFYVKNSDELLNGGERQPNVQYIEDIIYDPGVGSLGSKEIFHGWSIGNPDYTDETEPQTIDDIRSYLADLDIKEGDTVNIYAMIFKYYNVSYIGEKEGVSLGTETILLSSNTTSAEYTVNMPYTPSTGDKNFEGWLVAEGGNNIADHEDGKNYPNGTEIMISGDVKFSINAPSGYWLIFHENGGTYVAPQFIKTGETTKTPSVEMRKLGHTFGGWYKDENCSAGNEFTFGGTLNDRQDVYAKWTANTTADYTVIIWKQNVKDSKDAADSAKTYDFAESITLNGAVGTTINTVTASGSGDNRYASVNGTAKRYPGFHLNKYDTNVTIDTTGNSVVNVYYDRNLITLTFVHRGNRDWITDQTMTGLYGSRLIDNGYTWPTNRWWYDDYGRYIMGGYYGTGTRTTFLDAFILSEANSTSQTFYGFSGNGNNTIHFLKEDPSNEGRFVETNTVTSSNGTFYISDKYNGYKAVSYSKNNSTWSKLGDKDSSTGYYASVDNFTNLYIRYSPLKYNLSFMDGVYVDGNGNPIPSETSMGEWKVDKDIVFESNISAYNKEGAKYYVPTGEKVKDGYVFDGWYIDDRCTHKANFTTMPEGMTVYAKWQKVQYRVFLHPGVPISDTSLNWGKDDQATSFRISSGDKVSLPTGTRAEYEFIAWYTDAACTQLFDADAIVLNNTTVKTPYDQTEDTELDKYGNPTEIGNNDAKKNRYWITRKLDLYAKWRAKLIGADGIGINYDLNGGSGSVQDPLLYLDSAGAVAQGASTPADPQKEQFLYWVVQKWDGEKFVDTHTQVSPGDTFTVYKADAKVEEKEGSTAADPKYSYTVQLRAEYGPKDMPTPTFIHWYKNDAEPSELLHKDHLNKNLQINEAVTIYTLEAGAKIPEREGYTFLGWGREKEYDLDESGQPTGDPITAYLNMGEGDLFLKYDNGGYKAKNSAGEWVPVTKVAADEKMPYHAMYAIWKMKPYKVTVIKEIDKDSITIDTDKYDTFSFSATFGDEPAETFDLNGIAEEKDGKTYSNKKVFEDIEFGTKLQISENADDYEANVTATVIRDGKTEAEELIAESDGSYLIKGDTTITFTNKRKTGSLKINKATVPSGIAGDEIYKVSVKDSSGKYLQSLETISFGETPQLFDVSVNAPLEISGLPIGSYTVEEDTTDGKADIITGYRFDSVTNPSGVAVTAGETPTEVTVTNNYTKLVDVTVKKVLVDPYDGPGPSFTFTPVLKEKGMDVTSKYISGLTGGKFTLTPAKVGDQIVAKQTFEGIPVGAVLTVTEESVDNYTTEVTVGETTSPAMSGDLTVADAENLITFTNTRRTARMTIEKVVAGETQYVDFGKEYVINVKVGNNKETPYTLKPDSASKKATIENIEVPFGATYTVSEKNPGAQFTVSYSVDDGQASDSVSGTITKDTIKITVTNTAKHIEETGVDINTGAAKTALLSLFAFAMMCVLGFSLKRRYVSRR
jgi:uncharacterized repeat protein (TIGR02543 family)